MAPCSLPTGPCPALISLLDSHPSRQQHWWLPDGGFPQRIAVLLAAPLRHSGQPAQRRAELLEVFAPLPRLAAPDANPVAQQAHYRYLIQLRPAGAAVSCWRRYPEGIGWQRRCGPLPLGLFVRRFSAPQRASN